RRRSSTSDPYALPSDRSVGPRVVLRDRGRRRHTPPARDPARPAGTPARTAATAPRQDRGARPVVAPGPWRPSPGPTPPEIGLEVTRFSAAPPRLRTSVPPSASSVSPRPARRPPRGLVSQRTPGLLTRTRGPAQ